MPASDTPHQLTIDGLSTVIHVLRFEGHEGLSQLFELEVTIAAEEVLDPTDLVGKSATLTFVGGGSEVSGTWSGIVSRIEGEFIHLAFQYRVTIVPKMWLQLQGSDSRIFQELDSPPDRRPGARRRRSQRGRRLQALAPGYLRAARVLRAVPRVELGLRLPAARGGGHLFLLRADRLGARGRLRRRGGHRDHRGRRDHGVPPGPGCRRRDHRRHPGRPLPLRRADPRRQGDPARLELPETWRCRSKQPPPARWTRASRSTTTRASTRCPQTGPRSPRCGSPRSRSLAGPEAARPRAHASSPGTPSRSRITRATRGTRATSSRASSTSASRRTSSPRRRTGR